MKKIEKLYYKIFIKSLKWFYLFLIISVLAFLIAFVEVKVDGISLLLRIWQG